MKKPQEQVKKDTTLFKLLLLICVCFAVGMGVFKLIGLHKTQNNLSFEQASLIEEQNYLHQQIRALQDSLTQPTSFVEVRMSVNKKQHKQKLHKTELSDHTIQKPSVDKKEYEYLELSNKLKVLLIRDPDTKLTQAALNVNAGSWSEPDEFPGLAHFLEHMLFQGSKTYPENSYFEQLIAKGGGYTNAYTEGTRTNYYFSIDTSNMAQALNVFAHFFIDPLLSQDMVHKEANAVNSEYEINIAGDSWKILHLMTLLSEYPHPLSRFTIGNLQSLLKPHVVEALRKFHEEHYSSNQMALVIRSSQTLQQLKEFIEKSEFTKIPNHNLDKPTFAHFGMPLKEMGKIVKYHINTRATTILYIYQLEDSTKYFKTKPLNFINSLVRSRHDNGLYNYLISKNLIVDMDAQPFLGGNGSFQFYLISIELSETLIGTQKNQALQVGQAIVSYFDEMLHKFFDEEQNPNDFLEETFKTKKAMADVQFKYLEKEIDIFKLSHNLNTYPPEYVLNAESTYHKYDPQVIYNYLADLMNANNMVIMIGDDGYTLEDIENEETQASFLAFQQPSTLLLQQSVSDSDLEFISQNQLIQSNTLYHLQYEIKKMEKDTINFMLLDNIPLQLPQINHYVPTNLALKSLCEQEHMSYIETVDQNTLYDRKGRQNIFLENDHKMPFYFTSKKECKEHEFEYEKYNHFPQLVKKDIEGKTWWRLDRSFSPTVYVGLNFDTAIDMKSQKKQALLSIFNSYVSDNLYKSLQQSFEAGYELSFDSSMKGLSLELYGWSDKFEYFYKNVLKEIKRDLEDVELLQRIKTSEISELSNTYEQKLYIQAFSVFLPTIIQGSATPSQMIDEINSIALSDVVQFQKELLDNFRFTTYFTGNILRDEVQSLTSQINKIFDETTSHIKVQNHITQVADFNKKSIVYAFVSKSTNLQDTNGVTLNYYQIGYRDQKQLALMNLLQKIIHNAAYSYLRTQLQLGYVVTVRFRPVGCLDSAQILVQGTAKPPYQVNKYIEEFLINYGRELKEMTDEQFEQLKTVTISSLSESDKNLKDKARDTWQHIKNNDLAFEEKEIAAQYITLLQKQDLFEFYDKVFKSGKLSLQIYGQGMIKDTMGIELNELAKKVESNQLTSDQTYSIRDEITVTQSDEFKQKITSNYNCQYKISNI